LEAMQGMKETIVNFCKRDLVKKWIRILDITIWNMQQQVTGKTVNLRLFKNKLTAANQP